MFLSSELYFQKQSSFSIACGKYAVNNLLGGKEVTSRMLDEICTKLEKEVQQKYQHAFGGDYDVNVLIDVLSIFHKQCRWLSGNKQIISQESQQSRPQRIGYLINRGLKPNILKSMVGLSDRHWIAVRQYQSQYYLFDSKSDFDIPEHIMNIGKFLQNEIQRGSYIIEVLQKE